MDDRDIQFNSFAAQLFDEIKPLMHKWEQAQREHDYALAQRIEGQITTIFTQRGYDLMLHVLHNSIEPFDPAKDRDLLESIPDMVVWPEHTSP